MKKIFFAVVALAAMTACENDEMVRYDKGATIGFSNAFIDNATRTAIDGSHTTAELSSFQVYGAVEGPTAGTFVNIFSDVEVTKEKKADTDIHGEDANGVVNTWYYAESNVQYWLPGKDHKFAAVVDATVSATDGGGMPTQLTVNAKQQKDALYASHSVNDYAGTYTNVAFTFGHILSKVKFTAVVAKMAPAYTYKVSGIKIVGAADGGVYTIGAATPWAPNATTYDPEFGNIVETATAEGAAAVALNNKTLESNYSRLLVPQTITKISCDVELYKGNNLISQETKTIEPTGGVTLAEGCSYNFVLNLAAPGMPITFSAEAVNTWGPDNNVTIQ